MATRSRLSSFPAKRCAKSIDNDAIGDREDSDVTRQPAEPPPSSRHPPATIYRFDHADVGNGRAKASPSDRSPHRPCSTRAEASDKPTHKASTTWVISESLQTQITIFRYTRSPLVVSSEISNACDRQIDRLGQANTSSAPGGPSLSNAPNRVLIGPVANTVDPCPEQPQEHRRPPETADS